MVELTSGSWKFAKDIHQTQNEIRAKIRLLTTIPIEQGRHSHAKYLIKVEKLTSATPKIFIKNFILFFSNIKCFGKTSNE